MFTFIYVLQNRQKNHLTHTHYRNTIEKSPITLNEKRNNNPNIKAWFYLPTKKKKRWLWNLIKHIGFPLLTTRTSTTQFLRIRIFLSAVYDVFLLIIAQMIYFDSSENKFATESSYFCVCRGHQYSKTVMVRLLSRKAE